MSTTVTETVTASAPRVVINYLKTEGLNEAPFNYTYTPQPEGKPQTNAVRISPSFARTLTRKQDIAPAEVQLKDLRAEPTFNLSKHGFSIEHQPLELPETVFQDDEQIKEKYYPEVEALLLKTIPGAKKIVTYNHRTRLHKPRSGLKDYKFTDPVNYPLLRPHIDQNTGTGAENVKIHADGYEGRALIVNAWRSIRGEVLDAPLAIADPKTLGTDAKVLSRTIYRDRETNGFAIANAPGIQWYYQSAQRPDEVLLFKQYDSEAGDAQTPAHSAFSDPRYDGKENVKPRYSIETRSIVLFE